MDEARQAERCSRDTLLLRHGREASHGHRLPCQVPHLVGKGRRREQHDQDTKEKGIWVQGHRVLLPQDQIRFYARPL